MATGFEYRFLRCVPVQTVVVDYQIYKVLARIKTTACLGKVLPSKKLPNYEVLISTLCFGGSLVRRDYAKKLAISVFSDAECGSRCVSGIRPALCALVPGRPRAKGQPRGIGTCWHP